jgi:hypothetical protein
MSTESTETAVPARNIPSLLSGLSAEKRSCAVVVTGTPGGVIHVRDGRVVAMHTPGAPGVEAVLLKSGRLTEEAWTAVRATDTTHEHLAERLVSQQLIGERELEVVSLAALFDAAFALSLSTAEGWEVGGPVPILFAGDGVEPDRLVSETTRRFAKLAEDPAAIAHFARSRIEPLPGSELPAELSRLTPRHRQIMSVTDGRRTPRDMAFTLGRHLYAVLLDLRYLLDLGLVHYEPATAAGRPSTAPRFPDTVPAPARTVPANSLPRRVPRRNAATADGEPAPAGPQPAIVDASGADI